MIMRSTARYLASIILLMAFVHVRGQNQLSITVQVNPPYTASYTDYFLEADQVFIHINNLLPGAPTYQIFLTGYIRTTEGDISVGIPPGSRWNAPPLFIVPGVNNLTGADLRPFLENGGGDTEYNGITDTDIRLGQLPEGTYEICLQAFDYNNPEQALSPENPSSGCSSPFTITFPPPPQLTLPINGGEVAAMNPQNVMFMWNLPTGPPIGSTLSYHFKIVQLPDGDPTEETNDPMPTIDLQSALDESPSPWHQTDVTTPILQYSQTAPPLLPGHSYAWQVRVTDTNPSTLTAFQHDGVSEPFMFTYLGKQTSSFELVYPVMQDTLPWDLVPIVARFEPHADPEQTGRFHSVLHITKDGTVQSTIERKAEEMDILWERGPYQSQKDILRHAGVDVSGFTPEEAQHINIYSNDVDMDMRFKRGSTYSFDGAIRINTYNETRAMYGDVASNFVSGMGRPQPLSPAQDARLPKNGGDANVSGFAPVTLRFRTSDPPVRLFPPFPIWIVGDGQPTQTQGTINERWRLEVSQQENFTSTVDVMTGPIGSDVRLNDPTCDANCAIAKIYKEVEHAFTPAAEGTYYWRVSWLRDGNDQLSQPYLVGPTRKFTIGEAEGGEEQQNQQENVPGTDLNCLAGCATPQIPAEERMPVNTAVVNDTIDIGLFHMRLTRITWTGVDASGEGTIMVPFMHAPLRVGFDRIRINARKRLFQGEVKAKYDNSDVIPAAWIQGGAMAAGFNEQQARNIEDYVNHEGRLVSQMTLSNPMGLPIALDAPTPDVPLSIDILAMRFVDTLATMNAAMIYRIPEENLVLGLGNMDMPFTPSGPGCVTKQATLYLVNDVKVEVSNDHDSLVFKGTKFESDDFQAVRDSGTFVAWDCHGFRAITIDGEYRFSKETLVEDMPDGTDGPTSIVAAFRGRAGRQGFLVRADFNKPFHLKGTPGWGFDVQEAWFDRASYTNPTNIKFPKDYGPITGLATAGNAIPPSWYGLYIQRAMLRLPEEMESFDHTGRVTAVVDHLIIDGNGLSSELKAANLLGPDEGNLDGWGYSLDTLEIDIIANSFSQGGFKGRIHLPISDTLLLYSAMVQQNIMTNDWRAEFLMRPEHDLSVHFLAATMTLDETSTVLAGLSDPVLGNYAKATLNGKISIDQQAGGIPINFRDVKFQGLRFQTQAPYTNIDSTAVFSLASPQKYLGASEVLDDDDPLAPIPGGSTGGFPISLTSVSGVRTTIDGKPAAGVAFDINVKLTNDSNIFKATTRIEVLGTINTSAIHKWGDNEVRLDSIGVTGGIGAVEISGGLKWYRDSPTFGNGIKGGLRAKFMKGKIEILAMAQFGSVGSTNYWYVDAMAAKEGGWNKPSAFTIYGFGGGAWYHMSPLSTPPPAESITQQELTHLNDPDFEPGLTLTGMNYKPDATIDLGFKATIVFGDPSSGYAYNGNITALAQFAGGGLQSIGLTGDVYLLHKREVDGVVEGHVPIKGHGEILFVFATDVFTANFDMFVDIRPNLLVGTLDANKKAGRLEVMITPDTWHFYIGRPDARCGLKIAGFLESDSYFMVGDDLPGVPPPPPEVANYVPPGYLVREDISNGSGLAFGSMVQFKHTGEFLVFRYDVGGLVGFDLLFRSSSTMECDGIDDPGIGPFYARGQLYGAINASVSLYVDTYIYTGNHHIFTVGVAGMFQCGFANPSWLKGFAEGHYSILGGLVEGEANVPFEAGTVCQPRPGSVLDDLDPIGDLSPADRSGLPPLCSNFLICGVDCGVEPQAVFNMKVDQQIEFNEVTADHRLVPHVIRVVIDKFELKNELGQLVATTLNLATNHTRASLHPQEYLAPKQQFTVTIKLRAEELKNGAWTDVMKGGVKATWERTHTFKTDGGIEELSAQDLDFTYPFFRQRFVLQDECRNGVIQCKSNLQGQPVFKSPYGKRRTYKVVITSMSGGTPLIQDVTPEHNGNSHVDFTLPQLLNNRTYSVKLVARDVFDASNLSFSADGPASSPPAQGQFPGQQIANVSTQTMSMGAIASNNTTSNQGMVIRTNRVIQGYALRPDEKLLYEYHFRTSNFNTITEKVAALVNTSTEYTIKTGTPPKESLTPSFTGERFDIYDLTGFNYGSQGLLKVYPLIGVQDAKSDIWHNQFAKPILYDYYAAIKASDCSSLELQRSTIMTSNGLFTTTTYLDHPDPVGIPPFLTVSFHPDGPSPSPVLSDSETAPATTFGMNLGNLSLTDNGPSTGPPLTARLQYKTGEWVAKDYVRLQTITPDVIQHCGPLNHSTGGDDVYYEMAEPLRSYVIAFQNTPYKNMFSGTYGAKFFFYPPPSCATYAIETNDVITYSTGIATFQHTSGTTPPRWTPGTGALAPVTVPVSNGTRTP